MGKTSGTLGGAGAGAAVGTAIMPGIGTAIGAIGGGLLGYFGSSSDKSATPYQANPTSFHYGEYMPDSAQGIVGAYQQQGANLRDQAASSQNRHIGASAQNYANQGAQGANSAAADANSFARNPDYQGRAAQAAAMGRLQAGNNALAAYANQPQGPSAAQAQLQQGANQSFAQQLAMARGSGGGGNAAALRGAAMQQAGIMGQANSQAAQLRAQEDQAYRQQQLSALGAAQQGYGAEANAASGARSQDLSLGQLQAQTALQGGQLGLQGSQLRTQTDLTGQNQQLQNRQLNDQYSLGLGQLAAQQDQFGAHVYDQQLAANMGYEGLMSGNNNVAMGLNNATQNANNAGMFGMASAGMGAVGNYYQGAGASSDSRAKRDIVKAEGASEALAALGYAPGSRAERDFETYQGRPDPTAGLGIRSSSAGSPFADYDRDRGAAFTRQMASRGSSGAAQATSLLAAYGVDPSTVRHARVGRDADLADAGYYDAPVTSARARFPDAPGYQSDSIPTARFPDVDMRAIQNYAYRYRNPSAPGAAPGPQISPMAQDLEANPATAHTVRDTPYGKMVDTGRLSMVNTGALAEQQRRQDEHADRIQTLEDQIIALGGKPPNRTSYGGANLDDLDAAYARERAYR